MKDTKRKLMSFTFYDRTGIQRRLEEEAANGWMLESTTGFGWKFRRMEPAKIHFAVTYFPSATAFDPEPSEKQQRFQDFCAHTGWELVSSSAQLQIFCNRAENPIPIETDPEIELQNIHGSVKKTFLPVYLLNMVLPLMQFGLFFQRMSWDPIGELSSIPALLSLVLYAILLFFAVSSLWMYLSWYRKAKRAAADGYFLETRSTDAFQIGVLSCAVLALICLGISYQDSWVLWTMVLMVAAIFVITALVLWISKLLKKRGVSAGSNQAVTYGLSVLLSLVICGAMIWAIAGNLHADRAPADAVDSYEYHGMTWYIYDHELPLTIEDLMETDYDGYSYEVITDQSSPLLGWFAARQKTRYDALEEPELSYRVVTVKADFLYDWALEKMRSDFDHNYAYPEDDPYWKKAVAMDPNPWGADRAYQLTLGGEPVERYLLCYPDRIVEIDLGWFPTEEQMGVIGQVLGS